MNVNVVQAKPEHAPGAQEVFYQSWLAAYPNAGIGLTVADVEHRFADRQSPEKIAKRVQEFADPDPSRRFLVALDGEHVVGVVRLKRAEAENKLDAIYVLPDYFRQGIGRALWGKAQDFFDPQKPTVVAVATYNERAVRFYESLGFVDTGERFEEERLRMKSGANIPQMLMRRSA